MAIKLSSKGGGSGFVQTFASGFQQINAGAIGDIIVITPPNKEKARLTGLQGQTSQGGVTIKVGAKTIVATKTLAAAASTPFGGDFKVGISGADGAGVILDIMGALGEQIIVSVSGSTGTNIIRYSYEFGV